ncbi:MAG: DNA/RNA non-specific endonuclease [Lachnospiraceae bacterium]|nr:DNA/RNA non-specific endonuclease [Lachnospiraceae bacterium]
MSINKRRIEEINENPNHTEQGVENKTTDKTDFKEDISEIAPTYFGRPYIEINGNKPDFLKDEINTHSFEYYSPLDYLGRCGVAIANISTGMMPTEPRGAIGQIKPSGWHTVKYPDIIPDRYLYNRCHLIAYSLCGENDNEQNLITGTRYMNVDGMLPFEESVLYYIERTNNHVLYRVTPCFVGAELVARGVQIEAYSVEDDGKGICFNVYIYNVQPGITIDYVTGDSWIDEEK